MPIEYSVRERKKSLVRDPCSKAYYMGTGATLSLELTIAARQIESVEEAW